MNVARSRRMQIMAKLVFFAALVLMLAACRRANEGAGPTLQPTLTPTPRSTPLPSLEPTLAAGSEDNPVRVLVAALPNASQDADDLERGAETLAEALSEASGLNVSVELAADDAAVLQLLCDLVDGAPIAAWFSGFGYASATSLGCGLPPSLQVVTEIDGDPASGEPIQIIVNDEAEISSFGALANPEKTFCRVNFRDVFTWRMPELMLNARRVDPSTNFAQIVDYPSIDDLIAAVNDGECSAAGVPVRDLEAADERQNIDELGDAEQVPFGMLMVSQQVPLGVREALTDAMLGLSGGEAERALEAVFGASALTEVSTQDLENWIGFLAESGLNFSRLNGSPVN
jgi:ABC-type phosphate/phosphonate transport system substrate-binding protein